eukprot:2054582-Amphidinium_carterae.1
MTTKRRFEKQHQRELPTWIHVLCSEAATHRLQWSPSSKVEQAVHFDIQHPQLQALSVDDPRQQRESESVLLQSLLTRLVPRGSAIATTRAWAVRLFTFPASMKALFKVRFT